MKRKIRTPSELDLDARIAEHFFGWVWLEKESRFEEGKIRKSIFAPENGDWVRFNFYPPEWSPAKLDTEKFSDWWAACGTHTPSGHLEEIGLPDFAKDLEWLEKLLAILRVKGWTVTIESLSPFMAGVLESKYLVKAHNARFDPMLPSITGDRLGECVCRMAEEIYKVSI